MKCQLFQRVEILFIVFIIMISLTYNSLNTSILILSPNMSPSNHPQPLVEKTSVQTVHERKPSLKFEELSFNEDPIQYYVEKGVQFNLKTHQSKQMLTPLNSNVSISSKVLNSSFQVLSKGENGTNQWQNDIEPGYGDVNITTPFSGYERIFRLNFSDTGGIPASGITNVNYLLSSSPNLTSFPTVVSFDFRIPFLSSELLSSPHTLGLEFRFNKSSITFILSDFGGDFGDILEQNVTRPVGSDSLYILCNETAPFSWKHVSYNFTRLITSYFTPAEYANFANLTTLFCYMITFTPNYQLTLDINNIEYFTNLPPYSPINYTIENSTVFTSNGSLSYESTLGNFTFSADEAFSWKNNSQIFLEVNINRTIIFKSFCRINNWNETKIKMNLDLKIPPIIDNASSSIIYILLPFDWNNMSLINQSINFEFTNQTRILNGSILGKIYQLNVSGLDWGTLEAWVPNYLTNILIPTDISRNDVIDIRGDLVLPLPQEINLYLQNDSFIYHQTTLPMINGTFIFPDITISHQFPIGILKCTLNWSNSWEFGIFEKLVYVNDGSSQNSIIQFQSSQNLSILQFEPLFINISLLKNGEKYGTNSTLVFLIKGTEYLFFSRTPQDYYFLNISHIIWDSGNYTLDIIASDESSFFAQDKTVLTVKPAFIFWNFENLQNTLFKNETISFRIYSYIYPQSMGFFQTLSGLGIRIWINGSIISVFETNTDGFTDISLDFDYSNYGNLLPIAVEGILDGTALKLQTLLFSISNVTNPNNGDRAYIHEIMRSPVMANETFFIYYNISYSNNNSNWYVPIESFRDVILSAYILRGNYVIGTNIENQMLIWTLTANFSSMDTLVLELPSPTVLTTNEALTQRFRIKLNVFSAITINNFTIKINLQFLGFPFSNISFLDSLNRDITSLFLIGINDAMLSVSQLNIISGLVMVYFLEGELQALTINIERSFQLSYLYNETMVGSWRINTPINFSYSVFYTISGLGVLECHNTSLKVYPNASSVITAILPPQRWNRSISIELLVVYFTDLVVTSSPQNFIISDPVPPKLDYSIEPLSDIIRIHAFVHEPETASGVKNTYLITMEQNFSATSYSFNHYIFNITKKSINSQFIKLYAVDWAGNEILSDYINVHSYFSGSQSFLGFYESQFIFPAVFSIVIVSGILGARIVRKRKTSIF